MPFGGTSFMVAVPRPEMFQRKWLCSSGSTPSCHWILWQARRVSQRLFTADGPLESIRALLMCMCHVIFLPAMLVWGKHCDGDFQPS
jgi:hypothetical protein